MSTASKEGSRAAATEPFEVVAQEWRAKMLATRTLKRTERIFHRFERDVFPWLGSRPIQESQAPELLAMLHRIEARGALDTSHWAHQNCG